VADVPDQAGVAADRLYAVPPRRFVAERDAAVAAARAAGDTATADALGRLRRPTVSAWLVNLLALRRPELLAGLAELAEALRSAQRDLDGGQLRELTARRRAAVSALVTEVRALALEVEPSLTDAKLPLGEVESTLAAALADPEAAAAIRSGRLLKSVTPDGFGELPRARLRLVEGDGDTGAGGPAAPSRTEVEAELAAARTAAADADAELERVTAAAQEAKRALAEIDAQLAELTARRSGALTRVTEAEAAGLAARRVAANARRRAGAAAAALTDLE
jgi:hypothetical protein